MMMLFSFLLTLIVLCVVFSLLYWMITLLTNILPPPLRKFVPTLLFILLGLIAVICLLDLVGLFGPRHVFIPIK